MVVPSRRQVLHPANKDPIVHMSVCEGQYLNCQGVRELSFIGSLSSGGGTQYQH